jgi:5-methylcytosine-specific restriction protein A
MPLAPLKPCAYPGCPATIREGRYCPAHKTKANREYDRNHRRPDHSKIYGWRWRKIRDLYLSKHPLCEECLKQNKYIPTDEVHHIRSVDDGGSHDEENLISLCQSCHTKTRTQKVY